MIEIAIKLKVELTEQEIRQVIAAYLQGQGYTVLEAVALRCTPRYDYSESKPTGIYDVTATAVVERTHQPPRHSPPPPRTI